MRPPLPFSRRRLLSASAALCLVTSNAWADDDATDEDDVVAATGSARIDRLIGPSGFEAMGGDIGHDFAVSSRGDIVFSAGGELLVLHPSRGDAGRVDRVLVNDEQPTSFTLDLDDTMFGIVAGYFGKQDASGRFSRAIPQHGDDGQLAPSSVEGTVYLFGPEDGDYRLYRFLSFGEIQVLLASSVPIVAVADRGGAVFVATETKILRLAQDTPDVLFHVPDDDFGGPIRSLAVSDDGVVFFSTDAMVHVLLASGSISVINNAGGELRWRGGALFVLDPNRQLLLRLTPASKALFTRRGK